MSAPGAMSGNGRKRPPDNLAADGELDQQRCPGHAPGCQPEPEIRTGDQPCEFLLWGKGEYLL